MPSRAWTGDILADLLQLPSEIIEYVLESLAESELDDFARTPLGEFTWRPLLVGIRGYDQLGSMYAPIWTRKVASAMRMMVRTWANGAHAKHHFCSADEIAWVLRNSMIYGPVRTDEGGDDYFHDTPHNRQEFDACPIDGSRLWTPSHLDGCPCQAYITLVASFGPGAQHGSMFNWAQDNVRYVVQIVPHNDASNLDDLGRGLRHLFMWNGNGTEDSAVANRRNGADCPCCEDHQRLRPPFLCAKEAIPALKPIESACDQDESLCWEHLEESVRARFAALKAVAMAERLVDYDPEARNSRGESDNESSTGYDSVSELTSE